MMSALKRLRQEGCHKFKTSLDYVVSGQVGLYSKTIKQTRMNK